MANKERKSTSERARSQIVVKIIASTSIGALAFLITSAVDSGAGAEVILSIGVSVFVSGIAFMTQFLIDVGRSMDSLTAEIVELRAEYRSHADTTEQMIRSEFLKINHEFTKINEATRLFGLVDASDLRKEFVTELIRNAATVRKADPPLIFNFAQREMTRLSGYLRNLGLKGDLTYDGEDRDWLLGLTKEATRTIEATSLTTVDAGGRGLRDGGLWDNDLGRRYLEAQRDAVARGVVIRRLLVIDRQDLDDPVGLDQLVEEHRQIGVQVRILHSAALEARIRMGLADFIIIDGAIVYQSTATPRVDETSNPVIEHTRLITNPDSVRDRRNRYEELWSKSVEHRPARELSDA